MIAQTPATPYYAVIFTSIMAEDLEDYGGMSDMMVELAQQQPGYLGYESARKELGITISYWESIEAIKNWKANVDHQFAQKMGRERWYDQYKVRICRVERDYGFEWK